MKLNWAIEVLEKRINYLKRAGINTFHSTFEDKLIETELKQLNQAIKILKDKESK